MFLRDVMKRWKAGPVGAAHDDDGAATCCPAEPSLLEELAADSEDFAELAAVLKLDLPAVIAALVTEQRQTPAQLVERLAARESASNTVMSSLPVAQQPRVHPPTGDHGKQKTSAAYRTYRKLANVHWEILSMRAESIWKRWLAGAMVAGLVLTGPGASYAGGAPRSGNVDDRLRALEAEIEQLKRERAQAAVEPPVGESQVKNIVDETLKKQKVLAGWKDGFFLQSPSGDFQFKLRGYSQADARFFPSTKGDTGNDSFFLRRVRPQFEGTVFKYFGFRIMPDFCGGSTTLQDGYIDVNYFNPYVSLRAGKFKEPFSLERLQSGSELLFIERSIAQNIAPNRDVGVQLAGNIADGIFQYQLGIFDGVSDGGSSDGDLNSDKDFAGRVFVQPSKSTEVPAVAQLGLGLAGTYGNRTDDNGAGNFRTAGRSSFYRYANNTVTGKGIQWRIAPQAYWFWGP